MASFDDVDIFGPPAPLPDIGYGLEPMEPTPAMQRRDTVAKYLQKIGYTPRRSYQMAEKMVGTGELVGEFLPGASKALAEERDDVWGERLSYLDLLGPAGAAVAIPTAIVKKVAKKGIISLDNVYHGSPNTNLEKVTISKSKQSENFMPHISATDDPLLAQSFTKGELGNLPEGNIYQSTGNFKIIDYTTDEGKNIWTSLGKNDYERAINAKEAGFDGRRINNYEKLKVDNFYPEIDYNTIKNSHEIQMFRDIDVFPMQSSKLSDKAKDLGAAAAIPVKAARKGIKAYHGSPHRFEKFDIEQIGAGEGAQAYGRGFYFAEDPVVAESYRLAGGHALVEINGVPIKATAVRMNSGAAEYAADAFARFDGDKQKAINWLDDFGVGLEAKKILQSTDDIKIVEGSLYPVNIKASPDELIDWDAPIKKQSKVVQEKVAKLMELNPKDYQTREMPHAMSKIYFRKEGNPHGTDLITYLHSNFGFKETPKILESVGIKGIKYADAFSRGKKGGTSNYVIFDPRIIEIAKQYGVAIPVAGAMLYQQDFGDLGKSTDAPLEGNTKEIL